MNDDVLTRNENSELAVRTVSSTESATVVNPNDVYTRDSDGNLAVRVVGAGGGDQHNLGYYATPEALRTAHPTAEAGDFAIVGSTDTVWIWDTDNSEWKDSDQKGQVTSVNNQTGDVTLTATDVGALKSGDNISSLVNDAGYLTQHQSIKTINNTSLVGTGNVDVQETLVSGTNIKTINGNSVLGSGNIETEIIQYASIPVASEEYEDKIVQYVGSTDSTYTNGYFYKCVSDGQTPATYSWVRLDIQPVGVIIDDSSTSSLTSTWSANKLNTTIGNIETLLSQI